MSFKVDNPNTLQAAWSTNWGEPLSQHTGRQIRARRERDRSLPRWRGAGDRALRRGIACAAVCTPLAVYTPLVAYTPRERSNARKI